MYKKYFIIFIIFLFIHCGVTEFPKLISLDPPIVDIDGDTINNDLDSCPIGNKAWISNDKTDKDKDGCQDHTSEERDINNNGLIDIVTPANLYSVHDDLNGDGIDDNLWLSIDALGNSGCKQKPTEPYTNSGCYGYELMNDIDFDENKNNILDDEFNSAFGWIPIGRCPGFARCPLFLDSEIYFNAVLEGNGFSIKNFAIDLPNPNPNNISISGYTSKVLREGEEQKSYNNNGIGLFGYTGNKSLIRNLILEGRISNIGKMADSGYHFVGGLVGVNYGKIENCIINVNITNANNITGGVVGSNRGIIENVISVGDISRFMQNPNPNVVFGAIAGEQTDNFTDKVDPNNNTTLGSIIQSYGLGVLPVIGNITVAGVTRNIILGILPSPRSTAPENFVAGSVINSYINKDTSLQNGTGAQYKTTLEMTNGTRLEGFTMDNWYFKTNYYPLLKVSPTKRCSPQQNNKNIIVCETIQ